MDHLDVLESESIYILREAFASFENCGLLFSIGKDSMVLLHLAQKAFYPSSIPFPIIHIDTGWKFEEMIVFRDKVANQMNLDLRVFTNNEGKINGVTPLNYDAGQYTQIMKTEPLKTALKSLDLDAAFGGARRDEEKSRAKERFFSFRDANSAWAPQSQRPELWRHFNKAKRSNESFRVFPLSNWTELDIWRYIRRESIPTVNLYFAKMRPTIIRGGKLIMVDDDRFELNSGESVENKTIRFRTLGCYPLTCGIESKAHGIDEVIEEIEKSDFSERQGRLIDKDVIGSMEKKKINGYF